LLDKKDLEEREVKITEKKTTEQEEKTSRDIQNTGLLAVSADTTTKRNVSEMVETLHKTEKELSTIPQGFNLKSNFGNTIDKTLPFTLNLVKKNIDNMFQRMCLSCLSGLPGIRNIDVSTVHALLFKVTDDRYCKDLTKPSCLFLNEIYNYMIKNYTPTREEYQISKKLSVRTKKGQTEYFKLFEKQKLSLSQKSRLLKIKQECHEITFEGICYISRKISTEKALSESLREVFNEEEDIYPKEITNKINEIDNLELEFDDFFSE